MLLKYQYYPYGFLFYSILCAKVAQKFETTFKTCVCTIKEKRNTVHLQMLPVELGQWAVSVNFE